MRHVILDDGTPPHMPLARTLRLYIDFIFLPHLNIAGCMPFSSFWNVCYRMNLEDNDWLKTCKRHQYSASCVYALIPPCMVLDCSRQLQGALSALSDRKGHACSHIVHGLEYSLWSVRLLVDHECIIHVCMSIPTLHGGIKMRYHADNTQAYINKKWQKKKQKLLLPLWVHLFPPNTSMKFTDQVPGLRLSLWLAIHEHAMLGQIQCPCEGSEVSLFVIHLEMSWEILHLRHLFNIEVDDCSSLWAPY